MFCYMVKTLIDLSEHANRVINIVKAKHGLRNKSLAVELIAKEYERLCLEPELRPEFVSKIKQIEKERTLRLKNTPLK